MNTQPEADKPTPVDELINYVTDDQSNSFDVRAARDEYDALRFILAEAIEVEEGNYKTYHDPEDPEADDSEPAWKYRARNILKGGRP